MRQPKNGIVLMYVFIENEGVHLLYGKLLMD